MQVGSLFLRAPSVMDSGKNDHPGFVAPLAIAGLASSRSSWACSRPVRLRLAASPAGARPLPMKTLLCAAAPPSKEEEEDVLDEKALRAAEIHEVVTGLEDFKARIIDGAFRAARPSFHGSTSLARGIFVDVEIVGCRFF